MVDIRGLSKPGKMVLMVDLQMLFPEAFFRRGGVGLHERVEPLRARKLASVCELPLKITKGGCFAFFFLEKRRKSRQKAAGGFY